MKNIFNHTKIPYTKWEEYEEDSYDWDAETEEDAYEADADYIEGEEDELYYTDEEYDGGEFGEEDVYYEEELEEEAYYAEEAEADDEAVYDEEEEYGEYYEEELGEEAYYAEEEETYCAEEGDACYEGEEAYYAEDGDAYYAEDEDAYYADEGYEAYAPAKSAHGKAEKTGQKRKKQGNVFVLLKNKFLEMGTMDRIITATGVAVLILALVTGSVYVSARMIDGQIEDFVSVGAQLDDIHVIGEQGLLAVADAEAARLAAAGIVEEEVEERTEYDEAEYGKNVTVDLDLTSVLKDLKVKFVNQKTDKLVANVPFSVTVTNPDGKSETWSDDDMDGIIYKTELKPGKYKVALNALTDEKYKDYTLSAETKSVEVKKDIEYKKIDVKNEIKTESEINASKEDTKKNETVVESSLKDTVQWVESTGPIASYEEVAKSTIADPMTLASASGKTFLRMAEPRSTVPVSVTAAKASLKAGETTTVTAAVSNANLSGITWISSDPAVATVTGSGASATVTAVKAGTVTITFKGTETTVSGGDTQITEYTGSCTITVTEDAKPGTVAVNPASVSVAVGKTAEAAAAATGFGSGVTVTYSVVPTNANIATASVDAAGKITVTGKAAGSTTIAVTATGGGATATTSLTVTVTGDKAITLDKTAATVFTETTATINATIVNAATQTAVTAESSNTGVAAVSVNGRTVTVTGVAAGSATITVKYSENGEAAIQAACTVTVKAHPKNDKTTVLKDTSGIELYVQEGNNYRKAVYADYYSDARFYKQVDAKYTGWQTLDGKLYFFDASGKKVTGEQVIQGAKYNFASDGSLVVGSGTMGIDVSKWNGNIDWNAVKNSGVSYVIIRCGYRGSSAGGLIEDPKYKANIKGATAAGLKVGVYFFTQAINEVEAVQEASMVLEQVKNYKISYPIFLDVESSGGRADGIDKATRTAVCKAFCKTIQDAGYTAGVYANKNWFENKIDANALSGYKIWLAQYASAPTYKGRYDLWQYKSTGRVSGISGNVDLNLSYLGY